MHQKWLGSGAVPSRRRTKLIPLAGLGWMTFTLLLGLTCYNRATGQSSMPLHALLRLEAKTEKQAYSPKEGIWIQVSLWNISDHSLTIFDYGDLNGMYLFDVSLKSKGQEINLKRPWAAEKAMHGWKDVTLAPRQVWQTKLNLIDWLRPRGRDFVIRDGAEKDITTEIKL